MGIDKCSTAIKKKKKSVSVHMLKRHEIIFQLCSVKCTLCLSQCFIFNLMLVLKTCSLSYSGKMKGHQINQLMLSQVLSGLISSLDA